MAKPRRCVGKFDGFELFRSAPNDVTCLERLSQAEHLNDFGGVASSSQPLDETVDKPFLQLGSVSSLGYAG